MYEPEVIKVREETLGPVGLSFLQNVLSALGVLADTISDVELLSDVRMVLNVLEFMPTIVSSFSDNSAGKTDVIVPVGEKWILRWADISIAGSPGAGQSGNPSVNGVSIGNGYTTGVAQGGVNRPLVLQPGDALGYVTAGGNLTTVRSYGYVRIPV